MAPHHTKDKGDLGTAKAHADLVGIGFMVLFPATEHAAFDLVAYRDGIFHRIQVKYRSATRTGSISMQFCPETDACYYLRPQDYRQSVTLRVTPSRNGQERGVLPAANFRTFPATSTFQRPVPTVRA